jgi:hypothetical protein
VFAIERYEMTSGERVQVAGGPGGAVRPQPSPDGRWLAYVHREGGRSRLFVKDLKSGQERRIYDDLDTDLQETWAVHGVYPNMGLDARQQQPRLLGGRQDPSHQRRRQRQAEIPFRSTTRVSSSIRRGRRPKSRPTASRPACRASPKCRPTAAESSTRPWGASTSAT